MASPSLAEAAALSLPELVYRELRNVVEPYIRMESAMTSLEAVAEQEHRQIVAALEAGDEDAIGTLSATHCYHTRDRLVEGLRRSQARQVSERPAAR